jgi:putative phosphoribosyl transferase
MHEFLDRRHAGRQLGLALRGLMDEHPVILALPRGGVPVGYEVARLLRAPLDIFIVRRVGLPCCPAVAMGTVASGGIQVLNRDLIRTLNISPEAVDRAVKEAMRSLARREERYSAGYAPPLVRGRTVIVVDDGLANGFTMQAAVRGARHLQPARIVVAVPVGAHEAIQRVSLDADDVICLRPPEPLVAVECCYARSGPISDQEICELLGRSDDWQRLAS